MMRKKREKADLIPLEKSKRVIYLERRGRTEKRSRGRTIASSFLALCGVLCLVYCIGVALSGFGTYFFLIWGVLGVLCLGLSWLNGSAGWPERFPKWLKRVVVCALCLGLLLFGAVETMIFLNFDTSPLSHADYCVVLGAQWNPTGPGDALRRRLDATIDYLEENPDTKVIVTGGQGQNEIIAEGQGMKQYLIEKGIVESRIIVEDKATNTYENLLFSAEYLDEEQDVVVLVTSNFHVFRAMKIAEKQGYQKVSGLAADSMAALLPNNLLREFFGVIKDFLMGNM